MPNRRETTITTELVNILRNMRHGWDLETEVNAFIRGNSELDALVIERGREPIGIEAKFATTTNAKNLIKQAETRLVHELEAEYHTSRKTLNNVMAILYPDRFKTMPGRDINPQLRTADDLQYNVFINCPFDPAYKPLFDAIVFTVHDCGFIARCALEEEDATQARIDQIYNIIKFPPESKEGSSSNRLDFEIAITDNTLPNYCQIDTNWPCSNPKGYAEWFRSCMKKRVAAIRRSLTRRQIDNVPDYRIKTPIQRAIQILKRHRDIWFDKNQSDYDEKAKPISIIITTLAAHAYYNEGDLQQTLLKILTQMPHYIEYDNNGVTLIRNPVNPLENFAAEWQEHPIRKASFMDWLKQVQLDLTEALELSDIQRIEKSLKFCLGERVVKEGTRRIREKSASCCSSA